MKESEMQVLGCNLNKCQNDLCLFARQIIQWLITVITVIQVCAPITNVKEAEEFYEYLQDLLKLIPKRDALFIKRDWNAKVGSQEIPGVTGRFGLGVQNEIGQRLTEFCQENSLVIANTPFHQHHRQTPHMYITRWSLQK